jgi:hypothetical protein
MLGEEGECMPLQRRLSLGLSICVVGGLAVSCGGSPPNVGLGSADTSAAQADAATGASATVESDARSSPIDSDSGGRAIIDAGVGNVTNGFAPLPVDDGAPPPLLFVADSAPARAASDCKPGTYTGTFTMMVTFGGVNSGVTLMGTLSITLVANKPTPHPGEFNSGTLTVAPGAMFSGKDNYGDLWSADLSGQLVCGSRMFVGSLSNGVCFIFGSDAASIVLDGNLSAMYDPGANPVALVNGSIELSSPQVASTKGTGQWSAALQ